MLTDAFEKPKQGVSLSKTISDALKDYPATPLPKRSGSMLSKLQCFRPSASEINPNKAELRRQLKDAQQQYAQLSYHSQHAETALSGSVSDTLRLEREKKLAEAQAAQAQAELQKLQQALEESENRTAVTQQQVQQDIQLLSARICDLSERSSRISYHLQKLQAGSVPLLLEPASESGVSDSIKETMPKCAEDHVSMEELLRQASQAQQQLSFLEQDLKSRAITEWQTQQDLQVNQ